MAGGLTKYRHLSRDSSARQALLRGLVTQLIAYEHIHTTHAKAKEAQRLAEKLLTLARKGDENARRAAQGILYTPDQLLPKLFGPIRERYAERLRGRTRVTRTEPKNAWDQGESSILELVDGPRDSRFMITAKTIARDRFEGRESLPLTIKNMQKCTRYRGSEAFEDMVARFLRMQATDGESENHPGGTATDGAAEDTKGRQLNPAAEQQGEERQSKGDEEAAATREFMSQGDNLKSQTESEKLARTEEKKTKGLGQGIVSGLFGKK